MSSTNMQTGEAAIRLRNQETVTSYFAYQAKMNLDAWFTLWNPAGVFNIPYAPQGFPTRIEGRAALEPLYRKLFEGYSALRYKDLMIEPMVAPNRFVATWVTEAERVGGGTYTNKLIALFTLDQEGKVLRYDEYFDPRAFDSVTSSSQADGQAPR